MADRIPHRPAQGLTARESSPSDISEPEKKSKKKVTEESTKSGKKPRVTQVERSTEDHSDELGSFSDFQFLLGEVTVSGPWQSF